MEKVLQGKAPPEDEPRKNEYLLKKLDEVRKDCQWVLSLGAAGVLGVVIKDGFGSSYPRVRIAALTITIVQIFLSMLGSLSMWTSGVNRAQMGAALERRLRLRYQIRNVSVVLLAISFVLIAILGWLGPPSSK
jgi:hypothetical protein